MINPNCLFCNNKLSYCEGEIYLCFKCNICNADFCYKHDQLIRYYLNFNSYCFDFDLINSTTSLLEYIIVVKSTNTYMPFKLASFNSILNITPANVKSKLPTILNFI